MVQDSSVSLVQALTSFLEAQGGGGDHQSIQEETARFIRWCGRDRSTNSLTPGEIEEYCGTLEGVGEKRNGRLIVTKGFLTYLRLQGWTKENLASHAKLRRTGRRGSASQRPQRAGITRQLTAGGYQRLQAELAALKGDRVNITEEIRLAAATKDFSENAPLDAARERQGQAEARIYELETILKEATILEEASAKASKRAKSLVTIGSRVVLKHVQTRQEVSYLLVESSEADPTSGKLSIASPVGKAVLNLTVGDEVEVATPRGATRYLIAKVG